MPIENETIQNEVLKNETSESERIKKKYPKLPTPSEREEVMTEKDWDYYFECRRKYDKPMTGEEVDALLDKTTKLDSSHMDSPDMEEWMKLMENMPVTPSAALALKHVKGLKALTKFNLYDAKQAYPDEF